MNLPFANASVCTDKYTAKCRPSFLTCPSLKRLFPIDLNISCAAHGGECIKPQSEVIRAIIMDDSACCCMDYASLNPLALFRGEALSSNKNNI